MDVSSRWVVVLLLTMVGGGWCGVYAQESAPSPQQVRAALLHGPGGDLHPAVIRSAGGTRSPLLALGLSAAVPGLGQAYNRDWIMAGLHVAAEAALWTGIVTWRAQGNDGVDAYQAFAHAGWNPIRYASWLNDYRALQGVTAAEAVDVARFGDIDFQNPGAWSQAEEADVRRLFDEIRRLERVMRHDQTGASFSHVLPYFSEQQFYELIGKYYQFAPGWCDYGGTACGSMDRPWRDAEGNRTAYTTPSHENTSARFDQYSDDHAAANDLLRRASRTTAAVLLNHLVAGVGAAVSSKLHNVRVQSQLAADVDGELAWKTALTVRL